MLKRSLLLAIAIVAVGLVFLAVHGQAQKPKGPPIARAVYWANADAEVYLLEKGSGGLRLTVVSKKVFTVTYHTRINSIEPVSRILTPMSSNANVTIYDFEHNFTKMTIWMGLEFSLDGKPAPDLTRTFLNDINEVTPNGYFDFGPRTNR